jgi:hypothetical protein
MTWLILSPYLFFLWYIFYAGCLNAWHPDLPLWCKVILIPPIAIGGIGDIIIRFTVGGLLLLDWNYKHGFTFSQVLCYWYHTVGDYRKCVADWFASILNQFNDGHIS